jgi:hypothetical protein
MIFPYTYSCMICGKPTHLMETGCVEAKGRHFNYYIHYCSSGHTSEEKEKARQAACQVAIDTVETTE